MWLRDGDHLRLAAGEGLDAVGLADAARRADHDRLIASAFKAGQPVALPPGGQQGGLRNATGQNWLAVPIVGGGNAAGLVEVYLGPDRQAAALRGMATFLVQMAGWAAHYLARTRAGR